MSGMYVFTRKTSTISFVDAAGADSGLITGLINVLDQLRTAINSYNSGSHRIFYSPGSINHFVSLNKLDNDYYAGICLSSHMYASGYLPVFFSCASGQYSVFYPKIIGTE